MPKAYVILTEAITDPAGMGEYGRMAAPTLAESGATVLVADDRPQVVEGAWHGDRTVVLEFASAAAARAWYASEGYGRARVLRQRAAETNAVIVTGFVASSRADRAG